MIRGLRSGSPRQGVAKALRGEKTGNRIEGRGNRIRMNVEPGKATTPWRDSMLDVSASELWRIKLKMVFPSFKTQNSKLYLKPNC